VLDGQLLSDAVELLAAKKISELPVVNEQGKPVGLIDITDVVSQSRELAETEREPTGGDGWRLRTIRFPNT
jgi:predicted transcriptional regulator